MKTFSAFLLVSLLSCLSHCDALLNCNPQPIHLCFSLDVSQRCNAQRYAEMVTAIRQFVVEYQARYQHTQVTYEAYAVATAARQQQICGATQNSEEFFGSIEGFYAQYYEYESVEQYISVVGSSTPEDCYFGSLQYAYNYVSEKSFVISFVDGIALPTYTGKRSVAFTDACTTYTRYLLQRQVEYFTYQLVASASQSGCLDDVIRQVDAAVRSTHSTYYNVVAYNGITLLEAVVDLLEALLCGVLNLVFGVLGLLGALLG